MTADLLTARYLALGRLWDREMAVASIDKCNCLIRPIAGADQMPAFRRGKRFFTPEGDEIEKPASFEDMDRSAIHAHLRARNEVYIGHMFQAFKPDADEQGAVETTPASP